MSKSLLSIAQNNSKFNGKLNRHNNPSKTHTTLDIVYESGSNVLRLFEAIIGAKKFQQILNSYINKFAFKSAEYSDFVDVIEWISLLKHSDSNL